VSGVGIGKLESEVADAGEKFGVGVAEEVDGLHGVADGKAGAVGPVGPGSDEVGEELMLATAGVLKLVDEEVTDAVSDGEGGVRGKAVGTAEDAQGDLGYLS